MKSSVSADAIRRSYIDEATKNALLGPGNSFGLPMSTITSFARSELDEGPVVLVPAMAGKMIVPIHAIAGTAANLEADVVASLGWLAPPDAEDEHDEPWLGAPATLWYAAGDMGSLVLVPNTSALPIARLWPECVIDRPFVLALPEAPAGTRSKKRKEEEPRGEEKDEAEAEKRYRAGKEARAEPGEPEADPELSIVVFYTVF